MTESILHMTVNGVARSAAAPHNAALADWLREQGLNSVHLGCEHGVCGACNVKVDGQVVRACLVLAAACQGAQVVTLEGLDDPAALALKSAMQQRHGLQCGYCTPGMMVSAHELVARGAPCSEAEIREHLCGNICRCTGYQGIVAAVSDALQEVAQ